MNALKCLIALLLATLMFTSCMAKQKPLTDLSASELIAAHAHVLAVIDEYEKNGYPSKDNAQWKVAMVALHFANNQGVPIAKLQNKLQQAINVHVLNIIEKYKKNGYPSKDDASWREVKKSLHFANEQGVAITKIQNKLLQVISNLVLSAISKYEKNGYPVADKQKMNNILHFAREQGVPIAKFRDELHQAWGY
jgi:hypothetical protein